MSKKYKVGYATGSRADYGIVRQYLKLLNKDKLISLSLLVTGSHLEKQFGKSVDNIKEDGFKIAFQAEISIDNKTNAGILKTMAYTLEQFGAFFETNKYDLLIILGDRYEMMSIVTAAAMQRIPILHLHGGEATYGNYDEFIRHCITKMSDYHFTSTSIYKRRVIQLGEQPKRVYHVGALGAENCKKIDETLVYDWVRNLTKKQYFVIAFHPETLTCIDPIWQVQQILIAIDEQELEFEYIFIGTNSDTNSEAIKSRWHKYVKENSNARYIENLNAESYLYMVKNSIALIGNSSSGIIEAPSLGTFTINIGERQYGRVRGESVIDIACSKEALSEAIKYVVLRKDEIIGYENPYYVENAAENCYQHTIDILKHEKYEIKKFYDLY